jgi:Domain of unknown function (DUF222)
MVDLSGSVIERYQAALDALDTLPYDVSELRGLDETVILRINQMHASAARKLGAAGAVIAGDLAYRSRPELGSGGLARRSGHRTVENLLKTTTGATKEQVLSVVNTGTLLVEAANEGKADPVTGVVFAATQPWLRPVAVAVAAGTVSVAASNSIARGLGSPNSAITAQQLEDAATDLVAAAVAGVDADTLWRTARDRRGELDVAGVKVREEEARAVRGLTHHALPAGGGIAAWRMDPETYATFVDFYDRTTSPQRGGVRFVDPAKARKARSIETDTRDYRQLASDALIHFLMLGTNADPTIMLGSGTPTIRITVPEAALTTGVGLARIDGQAAPVSVTTVERLMETGTTLRVGFDPTGGYIEQIQDPHTGNRLYSAKQREILAAKFGGCMDPHCDRPPSWCEAHHILHWARDHGKTTIDNAILLCKYHHLKYHNDGIEITLDTAGSYWKIPPTTVDPTQTPTLMPLKTRNLHDLWATTTRHAS